MPSTPLEGAVTPRGVTLRYARAVPRGRRDTSVEFLGSHPAPYRLSYPTRVRHTPARVPSRSRKVTSTRQLGEFEKACIMPVLYAAVARDTVVLAEAHAGVSRDAAGVSAIARRVLEAHGTEPGNARSSYAESDLVFHLLEGVDSTYFLCAAGTHDGKRVPFAFLEDARREFVLKHGRDVRSAEYLPPMALDAKFGSVMANKILDFNAGKAGDALAKVQGELDEVKTVMLDNIERVLERGDKIELLVESTARLQTDAAAFRAQTRRVARRMWWNNTKMFAVGWLICVFVLYLIGAQFCGWNLYLCSSEHHKHKAAQHKG